MFPAVIVETARLTPSDADKYNLATSDRSAASSDAAFLPPGMRQTNSVQSLVMRQRFAMGFWGRLFGSPAKTIDHPVLGRMTWDPRSGWHVDEVAPIGCRGKPSLSVAGYEQGPIPECVATYQRLRDGWSSIGTKVAAEIFELNQNYFSDEPAHGMKSAAEVWESSELLGISISAEGEFSLTYRFDWQDPNDGHEVTMFFENWVPAGNSIDG